MTEKQLIQEKQYVFPYHYSDIAIRNKNPWIKEYVELLDFVIRAANLEKLDQILDAGCGDGRLIYELNRHGYAVDGVDYSANALLYAKAFNPGGTFYHQDLTKLKLNKKYSKVFCVETLEHIFPNKLPSVISKIKKVLLPDGLLIISVPSVNVLVNLKHYQHFTIKKLVELAGPDMALVSEFYWRRANPFEKIIFRKSIVVSNQEAGSGIIAVFKKDNQKN